MAHKHTLYRSYTDFRNRSQIPLPAVEDVAQRLLDLRSPSLLAPRQLERHDPRQPQRRIGMRQRLLTLPGIVAILVRVVWRRVPSVAEVQRVLARAGLWWVSPLRVRPQALTTRLDVLPAAVLGQRFAEGWVRLQAQPPPRLPHPRGAPVRAHFPRLAMVDGSTREALRKQPQVLRQCEGLGLAGQVRVMVEALSHRPVWPQDTADAVAHDQRCAAAILAALPVGGLWVFALGVFSFLWCDDFTDQQKCCGTRMREQTADRPVPVRSQGPDDRDEILQVGQYHAHPCPHRLRLVSVLWQGAW
jgi:hypothetical protein